MIEIKTNPKSTKYAFVGARAMLIKNNGEAWTPQEINLIQQTLNTH